MRQKSLLMVAVCAGVALLAGTALAHAPYFTCRLHNGLIECKGGFSDGSSAAGITAELLSADGKVLASTTLDAQSMARFKPPKGDFYLLMDAGPGHVVEVDKKDVKGMKP